MPDQVAYYRSQGWLIPVFRLPAAQVALMVDALDELIRNNPGVRLKKMVSAHAEGDHGGGVCGSRAFFDLARDPELVDLDSGVIGDDVTL